MEEIAKWTCDRCGEVTTKEQDHDNSQPSGWVEVFGHDLCRGCYAELSKWLTTRPDTGA